MNIDGINTGYVLDHIKAGKGFELYHLLGLDKADCTVAIIQRASSEKYGAKDIIKIDADIPVSIDVIGYIDPDATVNIIKNGERAEKMNIRMPSMLTNVIRCKNPRCITTTEQELDHVFKLTDKENKVYRCVYCETKEERII